MLEIALKIIFCLILAALLGGIIGFLLGRFTCPKQNVQDTQASPSNEKVTYSGEKPPTLEAPYNGKKDNLTRIKGIGIKIEQTLNELGIFHFDQIAQWNEKHIAWIEKHLDFPGRIVREKWVEQAKILASGQDTEFSKRVEAGEVATSKKSDSKG